MAEPKIFLATAAEERRRRPHAVMIPCPSQGHIDPLLKLAKLLHSRGFCITYIVTDHVYNCFLRSGSQSAAPQHHHQPGFRLLRISDGLPLTGGREGMRYIEDLNVAMATTLVCNLRDRLAEIKDGDRGEDEDEGEVFPSVTCVITALLGPALQVAEELGIPGLLFWTISACGFMNALYSRELIERGYLPHLKGERQSCSTPPDVGYLDAVIDWIPGLRPVRLRDMFTFWSALDPDDVLLKGDMEAAVWARRATGVILNTWDGFEREVVEAIRPMFRKLYTVGPLSELCRRAGVERLRPLGSFRITTWAEDRACLSWLDTREPKSVVYVNFGSITVLERHQLLEFAWGLADSRKPFLWILRPDLVPGAAGFTAETLPEDFVEETKSRGFLGGWCAQEEVLAHPSVGGFLTHGGWNSMLESVVNGVPMLCWPFFADQPMNCRYACDEWSVAAEVEGEVRRDRVEKWVRELMGGEGGRRLAANVGKWKEKAGEAVGERGSSSQNMELLIKDLFRDSCSLF